MREWWSIAELVELGHPHLPAHAKSMRRLAAERRWPEDRNRCRTVPAQGGERTEYHYTLLPPLVQASIAARAKMAELAAPEVDAEALRAQSLWAAFAAAPAAARAESDARLDALLRILALAAEMPIRDAVAAIAKRTGTSARTLHRWRSMVAGVPRADWRAALLPGAAPREARATCDPRAWELLVSDYLRASGPSFRSCYDRTAEAAAARGWGALPAYATLKRRLDREVPAAAQVMARQGKAAAARLFPSQTRDRGVFHAMEAVNADGHVFDVFVRWEDGTIARPTMIGFQDLYSGMLLSHRISRTESKETTRLAIADMVESWGIPEHVYFDNGRAFMSKWITGGMPFRFRFKVKDEEPEGILTKMGVHVHAVTPYHGQAKPIERAWRDLADRISRHPAMDGAYTGNTPLAKPENYRACAIPIAEFRQFVAQEISRHNTRTGRNTRTARGRSFAETFEESLNAAGTLVRRATEMQRQFFLLAGEGITARRTNGELHLGENRYWCESLVAHRGRKLMVRFDPDHLHDDLHVYSLDGRFIDRAPCIEAVGFQDAEAARRQAQARRLYARKLRELLDAERRLSAAQVAALAPPPDDEPIARPKVVGMHVPPAAGRADEAGAAFGRGVAAAAGGADIFDLPSRKRGG